MADTKISALGSLSAPDAADLFVAVDVSDTSMAASGTDKSVTGSILAGFAGAVVTKTANYTATTADNVILADTNSGNVTITLPTAASVAGRRYVVKRADSAASANTLTVATTSSQTIDGATTLTLDLDKHWVTVVSDGSNWQIVELGPGVRTRWRQSSRVTITATGETTLLGTGVGSKSIPANTLTVGKVYRFHPRGIFSTGASGTGTFTLNFKIGGTTVVAATAQTFPTTNLSNVYWEADIALTCQSTGVSGTVDVEGVLFLKSSSTASVTFNLVASSAATVDTTSAQAIDLTLSLSTAVNSWTCTNATIESLN